VLFALIGCKRRDPWEEGKRVFHMGLRATVNHVEPVRAGGQYDSLVQSVAYQPLFQYEYGKRPLELEPLLLASMPEVSDDLSTYTFHLKEGIRFHDDPCFEGGVGRELVAEDVIHSFKRMADESLSPTGWWLFQGRIAGFDAFHDRKPFDMDAPVEGLRAIDAKTFQVQLTAPSPQFLYVLATQYTAVVAKGCSGPIGSGPFRLKTWLPGQRFVWEKVPIHWEHGLGNLDGIVMHMYEQEQPLWLKFRAGDLDFVQVPAEFQPSVFDEEWRMRDAFVKEGVGSFTYEIIDMVFRGFDMEHPITGGFERGKKIRNAIALAIDMEEIGDAFYNGAIEVYDGPIPPGLDGHLPKHGGPDPERAKALLAEAGYPEGKGLPPIELHTFRSSATVEQTEMLARQLKKIGVQLVGNYHSFPELDAKIKKKQCQMFGLSWNADYPDAENFLALFYGPNSSPGSNGSNYRNPEYDALYEKSRLMPPSAERTAIYGKMRDMVIEDAPVVGTFARRRYYVWNPRVRNVIPEEIWYGWVKYVELQ
jgi:oligopeptide transport system substrate-binding protein